MIDAPALERACLRAWPGAHVETRFGWVMQATQGHSLRANAIWPLDWSGEASLADAITYAADWCRKHDIAPCFKLADGATFPSNLPMTLDVHGYSPTHETLVMTRTLRRSPDASAADGVLLLNGANDSIWSPLRQSAPSAEDYAERRAIVERLAEPHVFALMQSEGRDAAIGLGVLTGDLIGLYLMRTAPWARRRGLAAAIVGALINWGVARGACAAYLQVEKDNAPAVALYERAGFTLAYRYRYWR